MKSIVYNQSEVAKNIPPFERLVLNMAFEASLRGSSESQGSTLNLPGQVCVPDFDVVAPIATSIAYRTFVPRAVEIYQRFNTHLDSGTVLPNELINELEVCARGNILASRLKVQKSSGK